MRNQLTLEFRGV